MKNTPRLTTLRAHARRALLAAALLVASPTVAFAAVDGGDHHFPWGSFAATWLNFFIFFAILWKFALPPIQKYFKERRASLEANLNEAKLLREEAAAKLAEYESKLDALDVERKALLAEYKEQGEREKERLIEEGTRQITKLRSDAERVIEQEVKKAKAALEARAVDQALSIAKDRAEKKLSMGGQDKLVHRYIDDLKQMQQAG